MKPSGRLDRSVPIDRHTALKRETRMKRTGPPATESAKRKAERPARRAVRDETIERAGGRCEAADKVPEVPCSYGLLETNEVIRRGVYPGGHLDVANTNALCSAHHRFVTLNPKRAKALGLQRESWERGR